MIDDVKLFGNFRIIAENNVCKSHLEECSSVEKEHSVAYPKIWIVDEAVFRQYLKRLKKEKYTPY